MTLSAGDSKRPPDQQTKECLGLAAPLLLILWLPCGVVWPTLPCIMNRGLGRIALAVIALLVAGAFFFGPGLVERRMNAVHSAGRAAPSERGQALHNKLFVADLHADSLLWGRNLLERSARGHVDIPRMIEGNLALQAFTIVTQSPRGLNIESNSGDTDTITALYVLRLRPPRTWRSLTARALDQAASLREFAARSEGRFFVIQTTIDLQGYIARRRFSSDVAGGLLGVEGAHALDGNLENLDRLFDAGVRMMAPVHFFDNDIGGSAHGVEKGGLTAKGREWVRRMERKRMIVDLAHASPKTFSDVLAMATRPVVVSHTGVRGTCNNQRNLSGEQLRGVARTGGLIGIGFWDTAVCGQDAGAIARAIRHAASVAGVDHVALGSDLDGAVTTPFDAAGLAQLTDALLAAGFSENEIRKIMGENVLRVLRIALP